MTLLNPVTHIDLPVQEPVNTMRTLHRAMRDLDTYCIDGIWYTIWHKDQLPHGQAVEAFRQVDGTGMQIGQPLTIHAEDGHVVQQGRITAALGISAAIAGVLHDGLRAGGSQWRGQLQQELAEWRRLLTQEAPEGEEKHPLLAAAQEVVDAQ
mgnify:CR=1 FL=1